MNPAYHYTALFCEENIWQLAKSLPQEGRDIKNLSVLFLSNPNKQVVLLEQKSAPLGTPVIWDYHVILWEKSQNSSLIYDFDSRLAFPCPATQYFHSSFPSPENLPQPYHFFIRQIAAQSYLQHFYSSREHMLAHLPKESFPAYEIIKPQAGCLTIPLSDYWDMEKALPDNSEVFHFGEIFNRL